MKVLTLINVFFFTKDTTGKEITSRLLAAVKKLPNVTLMEHTCLLDIMEEDNRCYGGVALLKMVI